MSTAVVTTSDNAYSGKKRYRSYYYKRKYYWRNYFKYNKMKTRIEIQCSIVFNTAGSPLDFAKLVFNNTGDVVEYMNIGRMCTYYARWNEIRQLFGNIKITGIKFIFKGVNSDANLASLNSVYCGYTALSDPSTSNSVFKCSNAVKQLNPNGVTSWYVPVKHYINGTATADTDNGYIMAKSDQKGYQENNQKYVGQIMLYCTFYNSTL